MILRPDQHVWVLHKGEWHRGRMALSKGDNGERIFSGSTWRVSVTGVVQSEFMRPEIHTEDEHARWLLAQ